MAESSYLSFKCAVTTGGGGIGRALAQYFISRGKKSTAKAIGAAAYYEITTEHPDIDCLVNNAAVQRPIEVLRPDAFLEKADQEIDINIRGPMHPTLGLLPHLRSKPSALIINVSSGLGFNPLSIIHPVYSGTKAWLHSYNIRVVELVPPMVATNLQRELKNNKFAAYALTIDEFMDEITPKLERGDETIGAGTSAQAIDKWFEAYGGMYDKFTSGQ
ncbi:hypothetical protein LCI18_006092 [Fusarium solani-melongenae]|uniref:Uncharacterized protein n=1 Tax=Fusarium solani subsp. cucurbitae TaxID=2747967 RepID=A0ACD3Z1S1_FUSSC|nr:hypothetical protein LCI18_006092 [Fusarium solani-melongenae]